MNKGPDFVKETSREISGNHQLRARDQQDNRQQSFDELMIKTSAPAMRSDGPADHFTRSQDQDKCRKKGGAGIISLQLRC